MASPSLTLYYKSESCSIVAHALLRHLSIPFKGVPMKPNADRLYEPEDGSLSHDEFAAKFPPYGYVPVLVIDDDEFITEVPAILTYIACLAPPEVRDKLLGASPLERARVVEWMTWLSGTFLGVGIAARGRPYRLVDGEEARKAVSKKGMETTRSCYERVETRLRGREFAVGDALTVVDLYLYVFLRWSENLPGIGGADFSAKFPNYEKLMKKIERLPGVQATLVAEKLTPMLQ